MDYREMLKRRRGPYRGLHLALSAAVPFYAAAAGIRNFLYDRGIKKSFSLGVPVVSIGNLTMGGTGKTPAAAGLLRRALARGLKPALLSRGYRAEKFRLGKESPNPYLRQNDEAAELAIEFPLVPHYLAPDRVAAGRALLRDFPETDLIILDDGFQHRRLHRDRNILLLDALDPFGGGLFPAGFAREPLTALRRADAVILTRADLADEPQRRRIEQKVRELAPDILWGEAVMRPVSLLRRAQSGWEPAPFSLLKEEPGQFWIPFCGIGNPDGFYRMLENEGIRTVPGLSLPDHTPPETEKLRELAAAAPGAAGFVTTVKDLVKLPFGEIGGKPVWGVKIELNFLKEESFFNKALRWE